MEGVPIILEDSNKKFSALVKKPEKLLEKNGDLIERTKLLTKVIYDVSKLLEPTPCLKTLPELIVDGFDCEQVPFTTDLRASGIYAEYLTGMGRCGASKPGSFE